MLLKLMLVFTVLENWPLLKRNFVLVLIVGVFTPSQLRPLSLLLAVAKLVFTVLEN